MPTALVRKTNKEQINKQTNTNEAFVKLKYVSVVQMDPWMCGTV